MSPPPPADHGPDDRAGWNDHRHDRDDPDPFHALWLDRSVPLDDQAKAAMLADQRSWIRQFALPVLRPVARVLIVLIQLAKILAPRARLPRFLHLLLWWGMSLLVTRRANWLILRHFHIGTEILAFVRANAGVGELPADPLRPSSLREIRDNLFVRHDLNLYNFVIDLGRRQRESGRAPAAPDRVDYAMITDGPFPIGPLPDRWCNCLDLETAIELFTPLYQLLLSDRDFWRATNSLQLDETIAIHCAIIRRQPQHLFLVNNKHPLVPLTTLRAGHRLVLHGLAAECLHYQLRLERRAQAAGSG